MCVCVTIIKCVPYLLYKKCSTSECRSKVMAGNPITHVGFVGPGMAGITQPTFAQFIDVFSRERISMKSDSRPR